jgi:hypothetical protein
MTNGRTPRLILAIALVLPAAPRIANAQQCQLTIDPIQAVGTTGTPTAITITGNAPDCGRVDLTLTCQTSIQKTDIFPDAANRWSVTLTQTEIQAMGCSCPDSIIIKASCGKGLAKDYCIQVISRQLITCQKCPLIRDVIYAQPACSQMTSEGNISIRFSAQVSGNFNGLYRWTFDGQQRIQSLNGVPAAPAPQTFTIRCPRTAPPYTVEFLAIGCPGGDAYYLDSRSESVAFPDCQNCPQVLPIVTTSGCTARFSATLSGCTSGVTEYVWNFGHSPPNNTQSTTSPSTTHTYPSDGTYTATLTLGGINNGRCSAQVPVTITDCSSGHDGGHGGGCGWKFWQCISFNLCWLFALIAFLAVFARLLLLAMYDFAVPVLGTSFTLDQLLSALSLGLLVVLLVICPCQVLWGILLAVVLAVIVILVLLLVSAGSVPFWVKALLVAGLLAAAALTALAVSDCTRIVEQTKPQVERRPP